MKVVIVISNLEFGGAQRQVVEMVNAADAARAEFHICSLSPYVPLADSLRERERRLHVVPKRFKFDVSVVWRLAALLRRLEADVVHGYLFDAEIAAFLAGRLAGTPVIVGSERNTDYTLKRRQLWTYRLTRGCADVIIANSGAGADFNSRTLGIPRDRYRVIHNGVNLKRFRPAEGRAVRAELGLGDGPVVGLFASFKAQKNHPLFFEAARRVLAKFPSARFLLVGAELYLGMHGSDDYRRRMDQLVDELGLREHCRFLGNRPDVERLYPACDLTVLPSLFEGTPNVLLESMACGVPVVATDVSDNGHVVPDGRAGFLTPLDDPDAFAEPIVRLLEDYDLRRRMGARARAWVESEFSVERLASRTVAVYREALDAAIAQDLAGARTQSGATKA